MHISKYYNEESPSLPPSLLPCVCVSHLTKMHSSKGSGADGGATWVVIWEAFSRPDGGATWWLIWKTFSRADGGATWWVILEAFSRANGGAIWWVI